jgi:DNA-binding transcriptional LysR family regulator
LAQHNCLLFRDGAPRNCWQFSGLPPVNVSGRFVVDNGTALLSAVRDGLGVALLADFEIADDIATGRLVRLLCDTATPEWPLALVHMADRRMTAKLSRFVELARQRLGDCTLLRAPSPSVFQFTLTYFMDNVFRQCAILRIAHLLAAEDVFNGSFFF